MRDAILSGSSVATTLSLTLPFGLLALEVVVLLLGGSMIGDGSEVDELGFNPGRSNRELDVTDLDVTDLEAAKFGLDAAATAAASPLGWLGLRKMNARPDFISTTR